MVSIRKIGVLLALAIFMIPGAAEAAFAKKVGSKYGGTLKSNKSMKTQQLTADPVSVLRGSTSTTYDPSVVSLDQIFAEEGFFLTSTLIEVRFIGGEGTGTSLISYGEYREIPREFFVETGYVQVFYEAQSFETFGSFALAEEGDGYVTVDTDGETEGDNTHTMLFNYIAENESTVAHYRLYADDGSRGEGPDSLVSFEDPDFVIRDIEEANVAGALIPLPPALVPALLGFAGVGVVKKLRKRLIA